VNFDSNPDVALQQRIRWENASPEERRSLRPKPPPMPFGPPLVCSLCQAPWWTAAMVLVLVGVPGGLFAILWALGGQP
jgi:hypothetical protein